MTVSWRKTIQIHEEFRAFLINGSSLASSTVPPRLGTLISQDWGFYGGHYTKASTPVGFSNCCNYGLIANAPFLVVSIVAYKIYQLRSLIPVIARNSRFHFV